MSVDASDSGGASGVLVRVGYGTTDVARTLGVPRWRVRSLVRAGVVTPRRGPRRAYRFSFSDVIVLRTARDLLGSAVPLRRVCRALLTLQRQLPRGRPLTTVRIIADGRRVVVRDGSEVWRPDTGQILFDFAVAEVAERTRSLVHQRADDAEADGALSADEWTELGGDLEMTSTSRAVDAYRRALALVPDHAGATLALARLLHLVGDVDEALERLLRAVDLRPRDADALFSLGATYETLDCLREARAAYRRALLINADHADTHFNLATVQHRLGDSDSARHHRNRYRVLIDARRDEGER